jgi:hypothetical protein
MNSRKTDSRRILILSEEDQSLIMYSSTVRSRVSEHRFFTTGLPLVRDVSGKPVVKKKVSELLGFFRSIQS